MKHKWEQAIVKMYGKTLNHPSRKSGTHRKHKPNPRPGYVCSKCKLTALPPKNAGTWLPPIGDCK